MRRDLGGAQAPLATRCVLEGELGDHAGRARLGILVLEQLAPRDDLHPCKGGVVLVPLSDELLEVAGAHASCLTSEGA